MPPILLLGAGGHGRVVLELLRAEGRFAPLGFLDDAPPAETILGLPVLGGLEALPRLRAEGIAHAFVAIGHNAARAGLGERLAALGFEQPALAHPAAFLAPSARREAGSLVMARAVLGTEARLGPLAILNTGAIADHDADLGHACHVAPGCALAGQVTLGARALLGVGCAVKPGVTIGEEAVVGAGSAVIADIPARARVAGTPARPI